MPETAHGIVYPESTDHTRLWEHYQNLAESADGLFDAIPFIQRGTATVNVSAGQTWAGTTVTFPKAFANTPTVVATVAGGTIRMFAAIANPSTNTVEVRAVDRAGSALAATVRITWIAIGTSS